MSSTTAHSENYSSKDDETAIEGLAESGKTNNIPCCKTYLW